MNLSFILTFLIVILVLYIILKILSLPVKLIIKLVGNAIAGGVMIYLINFFGSGLGIVIDLNWINALITGILGVPGAIILLLLQLF